MKFIGAITSLLFLLMLVQCSQQLAGAGSETTNGVTGCVRNGDATPAENAIVKLLPEGYDPVASGDAGIAVDTTGADGKYRFSKLQSGSYNLLTRGADLTTGSFVKNIVVTEDSSTPVPATELARAGAVATGFAGDTTVDSDSYIYIPGTDLYSRVASDGSAKLDFVPPGPLTSVILVTSGDERRNVLREAVMVVPDETVIIRNPAWKYSRKLFFNTTSSGAGVMNDLYNFPVLIRLTGDNFSFVQAAQDGGDLLLNDTFGNTLPFEIERWDPATGHAEIWVTIDTLCGNSSSQSITLYWGASTPSTGSGISATSMSKGATVFDTTNGFTGVWHLGDATHDTIRDATGNRIHGISPDTARPQIATGIIGNCREFNGTSSFITMPNSAGSALDFQLDSKHTVSTWVYVEASDNHSHVIVSKGNTQYFLWHTPIHLNAKLWEFADYRSESGWDLSVAPISSGVWVLLTGVRDGTTQRLYVNGELADTLIDYPFAGPRNNASDLMIGRFAQIMASPNNDEGYCYFKGKVDEVRIRNVAESNDWVRLCYMNQQLDDKLVLFK